ncbi:MAG: DUF192 domain-containing protein [Myxococcales bacterium]|nr:DUF192 domain-containing protein [Myxococcales bacterium]
MQGAVLWSLAMVSVIAASCSKDADPASENALGGSAESPSAGEDSPSPERAVPKLQTEVVFETKQGEKRVALEVVSTPARIQRGLMHRQHLAPERGMVFVFGGDRVRSFWMKNTLIPLDMLFVTEDLVVAGVERDTVPLSLESRSIGIPTRYVIEVNGGWTAANGVDAGTKLRFENMPEISNAPL